MSSVSWNAWCDELAAVSGGGRLAIKAAHFPPATQPLLGSVVGFQVYLQTYWYGGGRFSNEHPVSVSSDVSYKLVQNNLLQKLLRLVPKPKLDP